MLEASCMRRMAKDTTTSPWWWLRWWPSFQNNWRGWTKNSGTGGSWQGNIEVISKSGDMQRRGFFFFRELEGNSYREGEKKFTERGLRRSFCLREEPPRYEHYLFLDFLPHYFCSFCAFLVVSGSPSLLGHGYYWLCVRCCCFSRFLWLCLGYSGCSFCGIGLHLFISSLISSWDGSWFMLSAMLCSVSRDFSLLLVSSVFVSYLDAWLLLGAPFSYPLHLGDYYSKSVIS